MRFGLQLHGTFPITAYGDLAQRAERLGFSDLTVHDVLLRRPVWPLLADIAQATNTVTIGPNVTHPYLQHPAVIAANAAHLDELSGGRVVVGLGRGSMYHVVGQRLPAGVDGLVAAAKVVRALLTGDESGVGNSDDRFQLAAGTALAFGARRKIPIHFGVFGERGVRSAGVAADGVRAAAQWDPAYTVEIRRWLDESASAAGRDPATMTLIAENWTCVHTDRELARGTARTLLAPFLPHLGRMLEFYAIPDEEVAAARAASAGDAAAAEAISDTTVDRFMAAGDAADLRRGIERMADAGLDHLSFSGVLGPDPELALSILGEVCAPLADDARS